MDPKSTQIKKLKKKHLLGHSDEKSVSERTLFRWKKLKIEGKLTTENHAQRDYSDTESNSTDLSSEESSSDASSIIEDNDKPSQNLSGDPSSDRRTGEVFNDISDTEIEDLEEEFDAHSSCNGADSDDDSSYDHSDDLDGDEEISSTSKDEIIFRFDTNVVQGDKIMFSSSGLTVSDVLLMVETFSLKRGFTQDDKEDFVEFVRVLAGPEFKTWNASNYQLAKIYNPPREKLVSHFFCGNENCMKLLISKPSSEKIKKGEKATCEKCNLETEITHFNENQFMSIDVTYQLKLLLNNPTIQDDLLMNVQRRQNSPKDGMIRDICDSGLYAISQSHIPGTLTYNINLDGAPLFESSARGFWPIQMHLNELSPKIRFSNIVLGGLFLTKKEPKPNFMYLYLSCFLKQTQKLMSKGITFIHHFTGEEYNFKFICLEAPMDSVARPVVQNRLQFNGHYGCSWCYDNGVTYNRCKRYILSSEEGELRTHEKHMADVAQAQSTGETARGVKGNSALSSLEHFDLVWGFPPDYMHGILLGVVKSCELWNIWTKPGQRGYLNLLSRKKIEERLLKIKRPHEIHRLPRPLKDTPRWKAAEWKSWLLYDSIPCLEGILDNECFASYSLLVASIATLLKSAISEEEIQQCEIQLLQHYGNCQWLYGRETMTFNLHSTIHLGESVRRCGPLWTHSTFPFENGIFHFKQEVLSPNGAARQIANKFLKKQVFRANIENNARKDVCRDYCLNLLKSELLKNYVKTENGVLLIGSKVQNHKIETLIAEYLNCQKTPVDIYNRALYKKIVLRSIYYTRPKRTDDTVIELHNTKICQIHGFIHVNSRCYIHGREIFATPYKYEGCNTLTHLLEISSISRREMIVNPENVKAKLVYFTTGLKSFIAYLPNPFEIQ